MNSARVNPPPSNRSPAPTLVAALVFTVVIVVTATFLPAAKQWRLWGINHLAFYDTSVRLAAVILMALAFVPSVARGIMSGLERIPAILSGGGSRSTLIILILSVASIFLFYELRAATQLLGDGDLLVKSFIAGQRGHDTVVMRSVPAIVKTEFIAPGMTLLYYWTLQVAGGPFKQSVADALAILPCILGGAFVFFLLRFVRDVPTSAAIKVWLLILGLFTASLQLYFGYIENYSAILLLLMLYVAAGFRVLHGRGAIWVPVVLLMVSVYTHIQSLVFLPSLLFLIAWRLGGRGERGRVVVPVLIILTVAGALVARALGIPGDFYLPLMENEDSYGIVSPGHLLDMLNETLILIPLVFFVVVAWYAGRRTAKGKNTAGAKDQWFTTAREWQFVAVMLVSCLVYMTFFKPEIGMARDWDLFTMASVALVPLTLLVVSRVIGPGGLDAKTAARVSAPALMITAVLTTGWIGVNASPDRTADRYEAILGYDRTHVGYAYENLASFYHSRSQLPKAIKAMENGAIISGNPRLYAKLASYYQENGDLNAGITILSEAVTKHPEHQKARQKLLDLLEKGHRWNDLAAVARDGMALYPREPIYCFALGVGLIRSGQSDAGAEVFRTCLTLDAPQGMRDHMQRFIDEYGSRPDPGTEE